MVFTMARMFASSDSTAIPRTLTESPSLRWVSASQASVLRQGGHHSAQNSTMLTFARSDFASIGFPARSVREKAGISAMDEGADESGAVPSFASSPASLKAISIMRVRSARNFSWFFGSRQGMYRPVWLPKKSEGFAISTSFTNTAG